MAASPTNRADREASGISTPAWGSDVVVDLLRQLGIEYVALLPGSTTRGVHDSIVNYAGNKAPEIILCNHEMITVAMARGYARVTGRPMVALVHNVVGLLNTEMTIYDAWCDRVPVLILGGTGPVDAQKRRPTTDWIHTANIQGNLVRDFTKWDDQPASIGAARESLLRAFRIAMTEPKGPVYVCLDVELQESRIEGPVPSEPVTRFQPPSPMAPDPEALRQVAEMLVEAEFPIVFADMLGRSREAFEALVEMAELLALPVIDMGSRLNFPTPHPLDFNGLEQTLVSEADMVLGLDAPNLFAALRSPADYTSRQSAALADRSQRVAAIGLDELSHRGFAADYRGLATIDLPILADTRLAVPQLLELCRSMVTHSDTGRIEKRRSRLNSLQVDLREQRNNRITKELNAPGITETRLLHEVWRAVSEEPFVFTSAPAVRKMTRGILELTDPSQFVSGGGGGAVGSAPGVSLGAALALKGTGAFPVGIFGDGGFFGGIQTLWTAAKYEIPSLWVINNNRSYYNDEAHQELMAIQRGRPLENAWIGQRMEGPTVDFAAITRTFGLAGEGPIREAADLGPALARAVEVVRDGRLAVVDVWTENRGRP